MTVVSPEWTRGGRLAAPADTSVEGRERTFAVVVATVGSAQGADLAKLRIVGHLHGLRDLNLLSAEDTRGAPRFDKTSSSLHLRNSSSAISHVGD